MVQAKPTTPVWNTADPLYTNVICALPFMNGLGTTATDISGNGHHATLTAGATWFNDPTLGVVVELDGTSGYVALSSLLNAAVLASPYTGAVTTSMWLRLRNSTPTVSTKTGMMDFGALNTPGTATKWPAGGSFGGETNGNGYINVFRTATRVSVGTLTTTDKAQWHHVAITNQAGGNWKLYINGTLFFTAAAEGSLAMTLAPILGRSTETGGGGPFYLDGWLGDFRVYNKELLSTDITGLFNSPWYLYTVTAPPGQARVESVMVDCAPQDIFTARTVPLTADVRPTSELNSRSVAALVDVVPYLDPEVPVAPPNNPGSPGYAMDDAFNPRLKPLNSGPPTLNADPVNTGTVLAMPLTEGTGTTANDRSGNANHGTLVGTATWNTSISSFFFRNRVKAPGAIWSTGTASNYIQVPDAASLRPSTAVTVACIVRPRGFPSTATSILVAKRITGGQSYALFVTNSGTFQFRVTDTIDGASTLTGGSFSNAQQSAPFFLVGSYDGAIVNFYVNGLLVATSGNSGAIQYTGTTDLFIGGDNVANGNCNAVIDSVTIWNRALTAAEVRQLYGGFYYTGIAPSGVPVLNAGSGAFGSYSTGSLTDSVVLMADVAPQKTDSCSRVVALMADVAPQRLETSARAVALMVDATPFIQNAAGLGIGTITPNFGSFAGGTPVRITGQYFRNVTAVYVGGVLCTSIVVVNENLITAVTGTHATGLVDVRVDSTLFGTVIAPNLYQYVGGLVTGANALLRGKQFTTSLWHQDPPNSFYTGEIAPNTGDTTLSFTLTDKPTTPEATEVYVRRLGETGYGRMRYGVDYNVDITNKKIIWKGLTAAFALIASDELIVAYLGQN